MLYASMLLGALGCNGLLCMPTRILITGKGSGNDCVYPNLSIFPFDLPRGF